MAGEQMDKQKPTDVILADFIKGQRKGRFFNFIITMAVPLTVLIVMFFGIGTISSQYTSAKQQIISELNEKNASIEGQIKEINQLQSTLQIVRASLLEREKKVEELTKTKEDLEKDNWRLRKKLGWSVSIQGYRFKAPKNKNKTISQLQQ